MRPTEPPHGTTAGRAWAEFRTSDLGQALATLGTPRVDHGATTPGLHANQETVRAGTTGLGGLVGALHGHDELVLGKGRSIGDADGAVRVGPPRPGRRTRTTAAGSSQERRRYS
jgi:hypothetical protein